MMIIRMLLIDDNENSTNLEDGKEIKNETKREPIAQLNRIGGTSR